MKKKNKYIGDSFDDFLKEEGLYEEVSEIAIKRVIAFQLKKVMKKQGLKKYKMAEIMHTSRSQLDRVLDPDNDTTTLDTLKKAASVVGKKIKLELIEV